MAGKQEVPPNLVAPANLGRGKRGRGWGAVLFRKFTIWLHVDSRKKAFFASFTTGRHGGFPKLPHIAAQEKNRRNVRDLFRVPTFWKVAQKFRGPGKQAPENRFRRQRRVAPTKKNRDSICYRAASVWRAFEFRVRMFLSSTSYILHLAFPRKREFDAGGQKKRGRGPVSLREFANGLRADSRKEAFFARRANGRKGRFSELQQNATKEKPREPGFLF